MLFSINHIIHLHSPPPPNRTFLLYKKYSYRSKLLQLHSYYLFYFFTVVWGGGQVTGLPRVAKMYMTFCVVTFLYWKSRGAMLSPFLQFMSCWAVSFCVFRLLNTRISLICSLYWESVLTAFNNFIIF